MEFTKTLLAFGLAAAASASAAQYEAEDGTLTKDAAVASNTEASGGKYVKMNGRRQLAACMVLRKGISPGRIRYKGDGLHQTRSL